MTDFLLTVLRDHRWVVYLFGIGGGYLAYCAITAVRDVLRAKAYEESRREIAAYVAEGSIRAEDAVLLIAKKPGAPTAKDAAGSAKDADADQVLARAVSDGELDEDDARRLVDQRDQLDNAAWAHAVRLVCAGMPVTDAVRLARARSGAASPAAAATAG